MSALRSAGGGVALLGLSLALLATPAWATDAEMKGRIEERLARAGLVQNADIAVTVEDGVARLTGFTVRYADLLEADRQARKETRLVVNMLRVIPEQPRSDKAIRKDAESAVLGWSRYGPFDAVGVDVDDGVVRLTGWVDTPFKRDEIEARVSRIDGIKDVHADLHLQGFSTMDVSLRLEIFRRIYTDSLFERYAGQWDPPVRVYVNRGHVTLAGTVGSTLEKIAAGHLARESLAFTVSNQLRVEGEGSGEDRRKARAES
jgi:osmotically-inducible protein OsmY